MDTWILLSLLLGVAQGGPDRADRTAVLQTLREYHDGLEAADVRRVLQALGPTYFIAGPCSPVWRRASRRSSRWTGRFGRAPAPALPKGARATPKRRTPRS
jgi:hypothetical protein